MNITRIYINKYFYIPALLLLTLVTFTSCEEKIDKSLLTGEPKLVIHGLITDQEGPYFVRITRSSTDLTQKFNLEQELAVSREFEAINNAQVTISDDQGNVDSLQFWDVDLTQDGGLGEWVDQGLYSTTHIQGVAGRTYTLTVTHEGQVYQAVATIPTEPPTIDEVKYTKSQDKLNDSRVPLISFEEPQQQKNYYRFFYLPYTVDPITNELYLIGGYSEGPNNFWQLISSQIFVFDDQLLPHKVIDLKLEDESVFNQELASPQFIPNTKLEVQIHSISKAYYEYSSSIVENRLFSPKKPFSSAPASPPTNISNGGLGFFGASSVKSILADGPQN
ncbi:MAG TPA: hypothetical protein DCS93_22815 [Microscillaceae bacterium]|nr:hypothetical protein [Microscillaceae bacterium]